MNKKLYTLAIAALAGAASANAQSTYVLNKDATCTLPFEMEDWNDPKGLVIAGATLTMSEFYLNTCGLPFTSGEPITLSNGGKVKFFDNPDAAYPLAADSDFPDMMMLNGKDVEELPFNWVIEGDGNEIYLDSYCTMAGSITGSGSVTIYGTDKNIFKFTCVNKNNPFATFQGTIIFKALPGYTFNTITIGETFNPGYHNDTDAGALEKGTYAPGDAKFDVTGLNNPTISFNYNRPYVPAIVGNAEVYVSKFPYLNGNFTGTTVYDVVFNSNPDNTKDAVELYGGNIVFNKPLNVYGPNVFVRSAAEVYINSEEAWGSNIASGLSQRGTGITGGTGYMDTDYAPNTGRQNTLSAGYPYDAIGTFTIKNTYMLPGNIVRFDLDGDRCDVLNMTGKYTMNAGDNNVVLGLKPEYFLSAKPGNYKVINGNIDAAMMTYNDTIGYEVWDNNGCAYVVRSVKGGEIVKSAVTGEEFTAKPGDSIGSATFGNLASKFGATCMDGNRPHYVVAEWGPGSFSNGMSIEEKNLEDPALYIPNANKQNYEQWLETWEKFKADHPVSSSHEAVDPTDKSVIPGTLTDSIFVTYSTYFTADGETGGHDWSWKNATGAPVSANSDRGGALIYSYYYYSNNTVNLNQSGSFKNAAGEEIPYAWSKVSFPRKSKAVLDAEGNPVLNEDGSAQTEEIAPADQYKTDEIVFVNADGSSVNYWFDFKNFLTDGVITLGSKKVAADGKVSDVQDASADPSKTVNDPTSIETLLKENVVVKSRSIFTLDGKQLKKCVKGINVVITEYTDGSVDTKKVYVAE